MTLLVISQNAIDRIERPVGTGGREVVADLGCGDADARRVSRKVGVEADLNYGLLDVINVGGEGGERLKASHFAVLQALAGERGNRLVLANALRPSSASDGRQYGNQFPHAQSPFPKCGAGVRRMQGTAA